MKTLDVIYKPRNMLVGRLLHQGHHLWFEYDQAFLATGLNLSPFKLKFEAGMQKSDAKFRQNLHGLFDDSLPDGWGLLLMDRKMKRRGLKFPISPLDRLAYIGESAMGALSYQPSVASDNDDAFFNLKNISEHAIKLFEGEIETVLPAMARAGGSPGGARPKVLVGIHGNRIVSGEGDLPHGYEHWIIKFAARDQLETAGKMEYAYYRMALDAGLNMMPSHLFHVGDNCFFGTKRFDRIANKRIHMHSVANLIDANFREPALDYETLCKITSILTKNHQDLLMMYRLMVFNVAINNQDDHVKNFSFLMDDAGEWRLSPAYDLTQSILSANEHSTSVLGKGKDISRPDMLKLAKNVGITASEAHEILDKVHEVVANTSTYIANCDAQ